MKEKTAEEKRKASLASMKSQKKRRANMTPEELKADNARRCAASVKSHAKRRANMSPDELAADRARRNAYAKAYRLKHKTAKALADNLAEAIANADTVVSTEVI